ncbi:MAG: type IV secretory system conjugative DNA transfer family protein, partial [Acidimicrobiales bacterium]
MVSGLVHGLVTVVGLVAFGAAALDTRGGGARGLRSGPSRLGRSARWLSRDGYGGASPARWARRHELAPLLVPPRRGPAAGRVVLGALGRTPVAAEPGQSVLVFGPTRSGKTSAVAVPAILGWEGPVVAASVKSDLLTDTVAYRRRCGTVLCFDPSGTTGEPSCQWSPLDRSATWPGARRAAAGLAEGAKAVAGSLSDGDFWLAAAAKLLAPLLFAAATGGLDMADVVRWVDTGEERAVLDLLETAGEPAALDAAWAHFAREERQRSSVATTAEVVLQPFADLADSGGQPGGRSGVRLDPATLVTGPNTLYLCAPAHEQRRLSPLFVAVLHDLVEHVVDQVTATRAPLEPPLLLVLDEAANLAPLPDLDVLASTAAGHGIQLVTVFHDLAQVTARYGPRAPTVVNNHRVTLLLPGVTDPGTLEHVSILVGDEEAMVPTATWGARVAASTSAAPVRRRLAPPDVLRRLPAGRAVVLAGTLLPTLVSLRPWFRDPVLLARREGRAEGAGGRGSRRPTSVAGRGQWRRGQWRRGQWRRG